jgi:hypothetical protein
MWLRELADGGGHIDASILIEMRRIVQALEDIIARGVSAGQFEAAHPVVAQVSIVGPILMFAASAPARERLAHTAEPLASPEREAFLRHMERAAIGALQRLPAGRTRGTPAARTASSRRRRT